MPLLSVLVPVAPCQRGLAACLAGLLDPALDLEVVVGDDGGAGDAAAVVAAAGDPRVRLVTTGAEGPAARDALLAEACGRYACLFDADAVPAPGALARQVALLERHEGIDMVYGRAALAGAADAARPAGILGHPYLGGRDEFRDLLFFHHIALPATVFRRRVYGDVRGLKTELPLATAHAWLWLLKAVRDRQVAFLDEVVATLPDDGRGPGCGPTGAGPDRMADRLGVWSYWLLMAADPPRLEMRDVADLLAILAADLPTPRTQADALLLDTFNAHFGAAVVRYHGRMKDHFERTLQEAAPFRPGVQPWPLQGVRRKVFLHLPRWSGDAWRRVVRGYGEAFGPDSDTTLAIWLDPAQGVAAEEVVARVMGELAAAGIAADRAPDLLLVPDALGPADQARLVAAAHVVVPGDDAAVRGHARRMGKAVLDDLAPAAWRAIASTDAG